MPVRLATLAARRRPAVLFLWLVALVGAVLLSLSAGERPISLLKAWNAPGSTDAAIFWSLRLPRTLSAALVGAALSMSGCALQALLDNPLADPFVLGVSGGAALGATVALSFGVATVFGLPAAPLLAFAGAAAAIGLVLSMARGRARSSHAALLSGVIVNALAVAAITFLRAVVVPEKAAELSYWLIGALGYPTAGALSVNAMLQALALAVLWMGAKELNLLALGDDDAATLGVDVRPTRLILLLAASMSVAGAVALSGLIGFIGLLVPHVLRLVNGPDQRLLLPASALAGASFLVLSDLLARLLFRVLHTEAPVGAVTALLGGPLFLALLHRQLVAE